MNNLLAEKILVKLMDWTQSEIDIERPLIQALANLKYDEYQQYSTGMRFTESLVNWLNQFENAKERNIAYRFIKDHLIFISSEQIRHLINICFYEKIDPLLTVKAAEIMQISHHFITKIHKAETYAHVKRKSLFLGLSDGAKIDQLRRSSSIDNEQIFSSYYISREKQNDMLEKLAEAIGKDSKFSSIYLIDDFTASGLSYFRSTEKKGKILTFLNLLYKDNEIGDSGVLSNLIDINGLSIHIIFYVARKSALDHLTNEINKWKVENAKEFEYSVSAVQVIDLDVTQSILDNKEFIELVKNKKYFDNSIVDNHYNVGHSSKPYLGFNECALPLVLNHNTPNNSLPILWLPADKEFTGLFPRVTRHKE
jgi:hypothetical protein